MYLVTNNHEAMIDRNTLNQVQQELVRRSAKRKVSEKLLLNKGKYSGKYALSEIFICSNCGTPLGERHER